MAAEPAPAPASSVIPPAWFVEQFNRNTPGPFRTALDPVLMTLWAHASIKPPQPLCVVTGI